MAHTIFLIKKDYSIRCKFTKKNQGKVMQMCQRYLKLI